MAPAEAMAQLAGRADDPEVCVVVVYMPGSEQAIQSRLDQCDSHAKCWLNANEIEYVWL